MASQPLFGGYASQVSPQRTATALPTATPEDYGAGIGEALSGAGQVAGDIAIRQAKLEAEREYDRQATDAMLRWSQLKEAYGVADNEARINAPPGAAGYTEAMTELATNLGDEFLTTIGHEGLRQAYAARIGEWKSERAVQADAFERGQTAKLMADQMEASADAIANSVRGKPLADYVEAMREIETVEVPQGIPQAVVLEWRRGAAQKATLAWLRSQEPEARKAMIDGHEFDTLLTSEQVEAVLSEADSDIRRKQIEAEAAARVAKADALKRIDDVRDRITNGYPVSDEEYAAAVADADRYDEPGRARDLREGFTKKRVNKEWQNATPVQIDARVKALDTAIAKAGDKATPAMIAERKALVELRTTRREQVKSDPLAAAATLGVAIEPLDPADPASFARRRRAAEAVSEANGVPAQYLTADERAQYAANATTPAGQLAVARELRLLGPKGAIRAAGEVLPGDNLFAYSMGLSPQLQASVLRGVGLRKEYPVPDDKAQEIWRETTGGALSALPAASREGAYLAAKELYRQRASAKGVDEFDPVLYRGAVREALGGNPTSKTGGIGSWNGAAIMLPPTMTQQQFDARLGNYKPTRAYRGDKSRIGGAELRDRFTPVLQPNGKYQFRSDRGEWAVIEDGRTPLEVDVSKLTPATGAAARPQRVPDSQRRPVYVAPPARNVQGPRSAYEGL